MEASGEGVWAEATPADSCGLTATEAEGVGSTSLAPLACCATGEEETLAPCPGMIADGAQNPVWGKG